MSSQSNFGSKSIIALAVTLLVFMVGVFSIGSLVERVDAGSIVVMQDPIDGELHVWSEPGLQMQMFGQVTVYQKSQQVWFSADPTEGGWQAKEIKTRFNDGGSAWLSGSIRYDLPNDHEGMVNLHTKYRSPQAIHTALLVPTIEKAIYMAGPLMSSTESYAARRSEMLEHIQDQITLGVYKTEVHEESVVDPLTEEETIVKVTEIIYGEDGQAQRQEDSPLYEFGVITRNLVITEIRYDPDVQRQIDAQREMTMAIQTAKAQSLQAEQDAITAEEQGKADAAEAKWTEEVAKATAVTSAERERDVATLGAEKQLEVQKLATERAKLYKLEQTLIGEGEAARRQAVMRADGALEMKLDAWVEGQKVWAEAMSKTQVVPDIVIGGAGTNSSATQFMDLMMLQAAKDLQLDVTPGN